MIKKIITTIWVIFFALSVLVFFVFAHEATHLIRFDKPQMMCLGFGEDNLGLVFHHTSLSESEYFKEEIIANVSALIFTIIYLLVSFYMIAYFVEDINV